ncbi:MAG: hypothetical protein A2X22_01820 [Bacteroidetes bacterium GWF2_49_14]|nr:MAG: hypothetical protein A2X22_01820 [Bacteroidetes bacterium GWF2_49_14]HBB90703.1 GHMP kinase [Bacteroidales bacterium]
MTGEYVVLHGATALAIPLKKGQAMEIEFTPEDDMLINWTASDSEEIWFEAKLTVKAGFTLLESTDQAIADRLVFLLNAARSLNPEFLSETGTYNCDCRVMFERHWGWGTSSTLISNIAWWADVDPYELNKMVAKGSGYDIACARAESALLFRLTEEGPDVMPVEFYPWFHHHLLFVYLGRKQDTNIEIDAFLRKNPEFIPSMEEISEISEMLYQTRDLDEFIEGISRHEDLMGALLCRPPLKADLFPDFDGTIKSLGAWGGDFAMAVSNDSERMMREFFTEKGYPVHFTWDEIIL